MRLPPTLIALALFSGLLHAQEPNYRATIANTLEEASTPVSNAFSAVLNDFTGLTFEGLVTASDGRLRTGLNHYQVSGTAGAPSSRTGRAEMSFPDVVFSSADGQPVSGTMQLNIDGSWGQMWRSTVSVEASLAGLFQESGTYKYLSSSNSESSGLLAGYGGTGQKSISIAFTDAPVGQPLQLQVSLFADAQTYGGGTYSELEYSFGFGAPASDIPLFDLSAGASVDIASANVEDGLWTPSDDLQLVASPDSPVTAGDAIEIVSWNGEPGAPVALFFTEANGVPILVNTSLFALLDADGEWSTGSIPTNASLAGKSFGLTAYSLYGGPLLVNSQQVVLSFQ